jgi:hypothetical protein
MVPSPSPPRGVRIRVRRRNSPFYLTFTPDNHTAAAILRELTAKKPVYNRLHFRAAGATTAFGVGDNTPVATDVELVDDLDMARPPERLPTRPPDALVVTMEQHIDNLDGTILRNPIDDIVRIDAGDADRKASACRELTKLIVNSVKSVIVTSMRAGGDYYDFTISASKGGVNVCANNIKFAVIFLGFGLPKKVEFLRIFKPTNRTLQSLPSRESEFLKLMVWPHDGAKGISNSNLAKVCAITRKLYKNLSRDCLCTVHTDVGKLRRETEEGAW